MSQEKTGIDVAGSTCKPKELKSRVWDKLSDEEKLFFKQLNAKFNTRLVSGHTR